MSGDARAEVAHGERAVVLARDENVKHRLALARPQQLEKRPDPSHAKSRADARAERTAAGTVPVFGDSS